VARQPVADHAAEQEEGHLWQPARGEDEPEVGRASGEVEDRECERDGRDAGADERDELSGEEEPELAASEWPERLRDQAAARFFCQ
jgi:hypothetical protein